MALLRAYRAEGIVIKRKNIGEADKTVIIFTKEYGKIRVLAKGVRKITSRRSGHLELFNRVQLSLYKSRSIDIIREASRIEETDKRIQKTNLQQTIYSYYLCELVDKLTPEGQKHTDIYFLLQNTLRKLDTCITNVQNQMTLYYFVRELLFLLGYLPKNQSMQDAALAPFIERIIERKLNTPELLTAFQKSE